jgi:parvulin-like peptidyl-prolyl cis-trans isomerase-like protein
MKAWLREPLVHFLVLGVALFVAYGLINQGSENADPRTIIVDREKLLNYVQYRSRAFDQKRFGEVLDTLPERDLQRIIEGFVREEAMYREAKAMQLDRNDYVSRLRLIQQLEFVMRGFVDRQAEVTPQELERYYETHKARYRVDPKVTFTHVYFSQERHGVTQAQTLAQAELRRLNRQRVPFEQAPAYGDRFFYHVNYVAKEPDLVASHFGQPMQERLFSLEASESTWQGPLQSAYGAHLVLVTRNEPGYLPPLEEVRARVEQDARQAAMEARFEEAVQSVVKAYKVRVEPVRAAAPSKARSAS